MQMVVLEFFIFHWYLHFYGFLINFCNTEEEKVKDAPLPKNFIPVWEVAQNMQHIKLLSCVKQDEWLAKTEENVMGKP